MMSATPSNPAADLWCAFTAKATAIGASVEHVDDPAPIQALASSESGDVVARGLFAVVETGSVLMREENAPRGACMLAERLWLLVPVDAIVATLDEAMARVAGLVRAGAPYVTLMSGPSRTADIERTLTIGVHGPRALTIVVVGSGA